MPSCKFHSQQGAALTAKRLQYVHRIKKEAVHGSRLSEPSIDAVRFAGGAHGRGDGGVPPAMQLSPEGPATEREVSWIRALVFV